MTVSIPPPQRTVSRPPPTASIRSPRALPRRASARGVPRMVDAAADAGSAPARARTSARRPRRIVPVCPLHPERGLIHCGLDFLSCPLRSKEQTPMGKTIGIDLGTTNSCMAVLEGGEPTVIPNAEGGRTTPSVVAFAKDGQRLVGAPAKRQQVTNPQNTISSIKRFMGRKWEEVSDEMTIVPYQVDKGSNGDARVEAAGKEYAPPEISAMILQKLKADAEQ